MKKIFVFLLVVLLCLPSCAGIGDDPPKNESVSDNTTEAVSETHQIAENEQRVGNFAFSFTTEKTEYLPGEIIHIYATVTNVSGEDHIYTGSSSAFMADIVMYRKNESGGELEHDPIPWAEDIRTHTIKNETSRTTHYQFRIPDDVKCDYYSISLSYNGEVAVWEDVIVISPKYPASSITISSGDVKINPIKFLLSVSEHHADGTVLETDGIGIYELFDDPNNDLSVIPEIYLNKKLSADIPWDTKLEVVDIYFSDLYQLSLRFTNVEALSDTNPGEYYVVLTEKFDESYGDPDVKEYNVRRYQSIFKLIIKFPDKDKFSFADVTATYREGMPGVVVSGFKNTDSVKMRSIEDVAERAFAELTEIYFSHRVTIDEDAGVWCVEFVRKTEPAGRQRIYLDRNGVTLLIVHGE